MAATISIVGGQYKVNAGTWTSTSGTVSNSDMVTVRRTSSASYDTTVTVTLTVGTYSTDFDITTREEMFEVTETYGLSGDDSEDSCTVGTETETLYTTNSDGIMQVGDWFYIEDGMGGYEVYVQSTYPIGTDPNYYWISYFEGATKVWVKLAYDSGVGPTSGDLIVAKGLCDGGDNNITVGGNFMNPTTGWDLEATAEFSVASGLTIDIDVTGDISGVTNTISVGITLGGTTGSSSDSWTIPFNPADTLSVTSVLCTPSSDATYTYIVTLE